MAAPTGITGMTGLQGLRGLQGPPRYAFQGPPYGVTTARITVDSPTSSPIYLTPQNFGTYFNITSNTMATDQLTISFPFYNPIYSTAPPLTIVNAVFGATLTIITSSPHKLRPQSLVTLAGMTITASSQNGTFRVLDILDPVNFRVIPTVSGPGNYSEETGTVTESTAVETTNEAFPTPEQVGSFWAFKNNCSFTVFITFSNGTVSYQGTAATTRALESGDGFTLLYRGTNGFIIL